MHNTAIFRRVYLDIKWCDHFTTSDWIWRHLVKWVICRYQDQMSKVYLFLNCFYFHKPKQKPNQTKHKILIALRTNSCCCSYWAWTMRWKMLFVLPLLWCTIANFFLCPANNQCFLFGFHFHAHFIRHFQCVAHSYIAWIQTILSSCVVILCTRHSKYELETFPKKINSSNVQIDFIQTKNDGHKSVNSNADQCHLKEPQHYAIWLVLCRFNGRFVYPLYLNKTNRKTTIPMSFWCRKSFEMDGNVSCVAMNVHSMHGFSCFKLGDRPIILFRSAHSVCFRTKNIVIIIHAFNVHSYVIYSQHFLLSIVKISVRMCSRDGERAKEGFIILPYHQLRWLLRFAFFAFVRDRCHMAKGQVFIRCHKTKSCSSMREYDVMKSTDFSFLMLVVCVTSLQI